MLTQRLQRMLCWLALSPPVVEYCLGTMEVLPVRVVYACMLYVCRLSTIDVPGCSGIYAVMFQVAWNPWSNFAGGFSLQAATAAFTVNTMIRRCRPTPPSCTLLAPSPPLQPRISHRIGDGRGACQSEHVDCQSPVHNHRFLAIAPSPCTPTHQSAPASAVMQVHDHCRYLFLDRIRLSSIRKKHDCPIVYRSCFLGYW